MDYLLTQEEIYNTIHKIPMSKYAIILKSTKNEYQYNHQVKIMERHALLEAQLEKVQGMIADMEAWYDQALDWREMEIEKAHKRIQVLEALLLDCKNQVEQVRKETAEEIITEIENSFQTWRGFKTMEKIRINHDEWHVFKSKYGIEGK